MFSATSWASLSGLCDFDFSTALTDDDTGLCRVDDDSDPVGCPLDLNLGDTRAVQLLLQVLSDIVIFHKVIREIGFSVPSGIPLFDYSDS